MFFEMTAEEIDLMTNVNNQSYHPGVTVIGHRGFSGDAFGTSGGHSSSEQPAPNEPADCEMTGIFSGDQSVADGNYADEEYLARVVAEVLAKLGQQSQGTRIAVGGRSVSVSEIYNLALNADFHIMPNSWDPGNGGVGQAQANGGDPSLLITHAGLAGYASPNYTHYNDSGLTYYFLHELAHVTAAGQALHADGNDINDEIWANDMARAFSELIGKPLHDSFVPEGGGFGAAKGIVTIVDGPKAETTGGCG